MAGKGRPEQHGHRPANAPPSPTYVSWVNMKDRCNNPNRVKYPEYGGRGISICPEWNDFSNFLRDMGERPSKQHSVDRVDNDGNYCPENCRWATKAEQTRNRRNTVSIEYNGRTQSLAEWAEELGFLFNTLQGRLYTRGWSVEKAFTTPLGPAGRRRKEQS